MGEEDKDKESLLKSVGKMRRRKDLFGRIKTYEDWIEGEKGIIIETKYIKGKEVDIMYYPKDKNARKLFNEVEKLAAEYKCHIGVANPEYNERKEEYYYKGIMIECDKPRVEYLIFRPLTVDDEGYVSTGNRKEQMSGKDFDLLTVEAEKAGLELQGDPAFEQFIEGKAKDEKEAVYKARVILQLLDKLKLKWEKHD